MMTWVPLDQLRLVRLAFEQLPPPDATERVLISWARLRNQLTVRLVLLRDLASRGFQPLVDVGTRQSVAASSAVTVSRKLAVQLTVAAGCTVQTQPPCRQGCSQVPARCSWPDGEREFERGDQPVGVAQHIENAGADQLPA